MILFTYIFRKCKLIYSDKVTQWNMRTLGGLMDVLIIMMVLIISQGFRHIRTYQIIHGIDAA